MNDVIHDDEEEKIRVEVVGAFFLVSSICRWCICITRACFTHSLVLSLLFLCPQVFEWLDFISLLSLVFDVTHESLSLSVLYSPPLETTTALRTRRVGESGVRRDAEMVWTGTWKLCFVFGSRYFDAMSSSRKSGSSSTIREYIYEFDDGWECFVSFFFLSLF